MRIKVFGKYYGWCPLIYIMFHLDSGTKQEHPFYWFHSTGDGFKWKTTSMVRFKSVHSITAWFVTRIEKKFMWGVSEKMWEND